MLAHELPETWRTPETGAVLTLLPDEAIIDQKPLEAVVNVQHGVVAARRRLLSLSYPVFDEIVERIEPGITEYTRFSSAKELGVSVLSFYRLNGIVEAPPTDCVSDIIASTAQPIEARLGRLVFFGKRLSELNRDDDTTIVGVKLAVELNSSKLNKEAKSYARTYRQMGIKLHPYPGDGKYHPHFNLAHISAPAGYFKDPDTLAELRLLANLEELREDSAIALEPVNRSNY